MSNEVSMRPYFSFFVCVKQAKQLQLMTGVNPLVFWGTAFVWDFLVFTVLMCLMVACFPIFQVRMAFTLYNGAGMCSRIY